MLLAPELPPMFVTTCVAGSLGKKIIINVLLFLGSSITVIPLT